MKSLSQVFTIITVVYFWGTQLYTFYKKQVTIKDRTKDVRELLTKIQNILDKEDYEFEELIKCVDTLRGKTVYYKNRRRWAFKKFVYHRNKIEDNKENKKSVEKHCNKIDKIFL